MTSSQNLQSLYDFNTGVRIGYASLAQVIATQVASEGGTVIRTIKVAGRSCFVAP